MTLDSGSTDDGKSPTGAPSHGSARTLDLAGLDAMIGELAGRGYEVHGPRVDNGVIGHDRIGSVDDLPLGVTDQQSGGHYRLVPRTDGARFGYAVGPRSWKDLLHQPRTPVWTMSREDGELQIRMSEQTPIPRAFVGVRPCELAAIAKQDRVLLDGPHPDPAYRANRQDLFLVAVNCGDPADTCFCPSMGTGPGADSDPGARADSDPGARAGYDIVLTELVDGASTSYIAEAGTDLGWAVLQSLRAPESSDGELQAARKVVADATESITRRLDGDGIKELIYDNLEDGQWDEIAERCLTCGNCTLACPTCFCTNMEDVTDLSGDIAERWRVWDSCFSLEFSHLGPGPERASAKSRYRQWLVHKLASWIDQFDESGCVGCGRCITWCPVGIDLTAEVATMRERADR